MASSILIVDDDRLINICWSPEVLLPPRKSSLPKVADCPGNFSAPKRNIQNPFGTLKNADPADKKEKICVSLRVRSSASRF